MPADTLPIVLIEDYAPDARLIRELLSGQVKPAFEIVHVETLAEALARMEQNPPDAALVDLALPDAEGIQVFTTILAQYPDVPQSPATSKKAASYW